MTSELLKKCPKELFPLFVYGTLMSDQCNHRRLEGRAKAIFPARISPARLWTDGGLPYLELDFVLLDGVPGDAAYAEEAFNDVVERDLLRYETGHPAPEDGLFSWRGIHGELILLPNDERLIRKLDAFEGFTAEHAFYTRSLKYVKLSNDVQHPAWVYRVTEERLKETRLRYYPSEMWGTFDSGRRVW